jgi:hypothetical protein
MAGPFTFPSSQTGGTSAAMPARPPAMYNSAQSSMYSKNQKTPLVPVWILCKSFEAMAERNSRNDGLLTVMVHAVTPHVLEFGPPEVCSVFKALGKFEFWDETLITDLEKTTRMRINDFDSHDVTEVMHSASLLGVGSLLFWTAIKTRTSVLLNRFTAKDLSLALQCMANLEASDDKFLTSLGQRFITVYEHGKQIEVESIYATLQAFHKLHFIGISSGSTRKGLSYRNLPLIQLFAKLVNEAEMKRGLSAEHLLECKGYLKDLLPAPPDDSL